MTRVFAEGAAAIGGNTETGTAAERAARVDELKNRRMLDRLAVSLQKIVMSIAPTMVRMDNKSNLRLLVLISVFLGSG